MFNFFKKKNAERIDAARPGFEEEERKTPKAGYLLLFFMFVASLFFGWRAIDDLQDVPARPEALSHCASEFLTVDWEDFGRYGHLNYPVYEPAPRPTKEFYGEPGVEAESPPCAFSSYETRYEIPAVMDKRKTVERELRDIETKLGRLISDIAEYERAYGLALQEKIANVGGRIYSIPELQGRLSEMRAERVRLEGERDRFQGELRILGDALKEKYKDLWREYRIAWRWYEFKAFLLEAIFVIPFFFGVFYGYRALLAQNSPYTIIFTALVGVSSVLFLRVLLVWFWSLFLARLIQTLWNFIQSFALLKSLVFYSGMLGSIAIFGGAVYYLQKRIFDPRRVAIRRIRQKQCPACQASLDLAAEYCPNCGRKLREKCPACGKERWADFTYCQHCNAAKA